MGIESFNAVYLLGVIRMKTGVLEFIRGISDGGAETLVKDYALLMDKKSFSVIVLGLFADEKSANTQILLNNDIPLLTIWKKYNLLEKVCNKLFGKLYVSHKLKKLIIEKNIRVLHIHMTMLKYVVPISEFLRESKVKLFYTCHSLPERYFDGAQSEEGRAAKYLIEHNGLQLIGLHPEMAQELNERFGISNSIFLRNGVDFNKYRKIIDSKQEIRTQIGIPPSAFVVGHVGRFHPLKNHNFIVEVFRHLVSLRQDAFLLLIGAGEDLDKIRLKLESYGLHDHFMILSNRSDVHRLMKTMDVFMFPSLAEGLGIVLIEAQVSGLRCIVSDTVPTEAFLTPLVVPLNLNDPIEKWCDAIIDNEMFGTYSGDLNQYDMNLEILRLQSLYRGN